MEKNKSNKKAIIIGVSQLLLVFILLFITSCGDGGETHTIDLDFHKGTKGVEFDVLGVMGEIYEDTAFKIIINVFNNGAYDLPEANGGYVNLNLEEDYMCLSDGQNCLTTQNAGAAIKPLGYLKGKSIFNPSGDFEILKYYVHVKDIDKQSFQHTSNVGISLCYQYQTDLITDICIDPYFYEQSTIEKPCVVKDLTFSGQGAPLVVTKIENKMLSDGKDSVRPMFIIHVSKTGDGEIINKEMVNKVCTADPLGPNAFNVVHLRELEFMVGNTLYKHDINNENSNLKCNFLNKKSETKLNQGKAKIKCTAIKPINKDSGTFSTQLKMIFDYGYTYSKSKSVVIKRLY